MCRTGIQEVSDCRVTQWFGLNIHGEWSLAVSSVLCLQRIALNTGTKCVTICFCSRHIPIPPLPASSFLCFINEALYFLERPPAGVKVYLCWSPWDQVTGCIQATSPTAACSRPSSQARGWWEPHTAWLRHAWRTPTCDGSRSVRRARTEYCSVGSSPPLIAGVLEKTWKPSTQMCRPYWHLLQCAQWWLCMFQSILISV